MLHQMGPPQCHSLVTPCDAPPAQRFSPGEPHARGAEPGCSLTAAWGGRRYRLPVQLEAAGDDRVGEMEAMVMARLSPR